MKFSLLFSILFWGCIPCTALGENVLGQNVAGLSALDIQCLQEAYGADFYAKAGLYPESLPPELVADPALAASMAQVYPLEPHRPPLAVDEQAGRVRSYTLLRLLYGQDRRAVQSHLVHVPLLVHASGQGGQTVSLSPAAARAFTRVARTLQESVARQPHLRAYILPAGGYAWRTIAGEQRLSPHSFGIAIDMNPDKGPYWRWSPHGRKGQGHPAQQTYPPEIVSAFEKEGFIWGGKWHKFDCMHFEYRPEIICKARKLLESTAASAPPEVHSLAPNMSQ